MPFDDPPNLTKNMNDEQEILNVYRRVRDEISEKVRVLKDNF
jgi:arsenate reductase